MMKRSFITLLSLLLAVLLAAAPVFAADEAYTYKVTVYAGQQGQFAGGKSEISFDAQYGQLITIDISELGIETTNEKYYVKGLKEAGHDNDEGVTTGYQSLSFKVEEDVAYVVTYAVAGDLVKYSVRYVDEQGRQLLPASEFYGMEGDKPVVSHKYVEGYLPNAYNETKTLTANEADNVFTFVYHEVAAAGETVTVVVPAPSQPASPVRGVVVVPEQTAPANNGGANGGGQQAPEPETLVDLDENQTPLAPGQNSGSQSSETSSASGETDENNIPDSSTPGGNKTTGGRSNAVLYGGLGLVAAAGIIAGVYLALRKRRKDD